jgi:folate-binding protein YgfZ
VTIAGEVQAIRRGAALIARPSVATIEISGADRVRYANGMLSCDVTALSIGDGRRAVKATHRGRIEALVRARMGDASIFLDVAARSIAERLMSSLGALIVMDDVALRDVSALRSVLAVYGPGARTVLGPLDPGELERSGFRTIGDATVIKDSWLGVEGYEVQVPPAAFHALLDRLTAAGAVPVSDAAIDVVRIEHGIPVEGAEIDDDTIPMEARLDHLIDFEKGCYVGQEVIARATNLGQIKHILIGLDVAGERVPRKGAPIAVGGKETGKVTSGVRSPGLGRVIALGFVRKVDDVPGMPVTIDDPPGIEATVAALPFI